MKKEINKLKDSFFAVCPLGLEEVLEDEFKALKITDYSMRSGGIEFTCPIINAVEFILESRIASRVYKQLYRFDIKTEKDLYMFSKQIKWKSVITPEETFKINPVQNRSQDGKKYSKFKSPIFLSQMLKDAIVDQQREKFNGERPTVDKDRPDITFLLQVEPNINPYSQKEIVTIAVDMCGQSLHERGYRISRTFTAPLKENLAAGIIKLAGYNGQTLIDPMCGSGTLLIEAMLIKGDIPPSFNRIDDYLHHKEKNWDFQGHTYYTKDPYLIDKVETLFIKLNEKVEKGFAALKKSKLKFIANDIDKTSVKLFIENLRGLDLIGLVEIENQDATKFKVENCEGALLVTNPPYGERIGDKEELLELYYQFGENLKNNFKGVTAYILAGESQHLKKISLRTSKKHILFNGGIETRLAKYELY